MVIQESQLIGNFFDACMFKHLYMSNAFIMQWPEDDQDGNEYEFQFACHTSLVTEEMLENELVKKGKIEK